MLVSWRMSVIATNSVSWMSAAMVRRSLRLGCYSAGRCPSVRGDDGLAGFGLAVVWLGAKAGAGEDATMLVACVRNISRIFWLMRQPMTQGEPELVAELPWDEVPIFSACIFAWNLQ